MGNYNYNTGYSFTDPTKPKALPQPANPIFQAPGAAAPVDPSGAYHAFTYPSPNPYPRPDEPGGINNKPVMTPPVQPPYLPPGLDPSITGVGGGASPDYVVGVIMVSNTWRHIPIPVQAGWLRRLVVRKLRALAWRLVGLALRLLLRLL